MDAEVRFATKPALAATMITRALDAGVAAGWATGDEVYGGDPKLRQALEDRGIGYVLAVAVSHQVRTHTGKIRADELTARLPRKAWQQMSAGDGSKGPRFYDWAWITIAPEPKPEHDDAGHRWLLTRRNNTTGELAYYRCWTPNPVPLRDLVRVAGRRWTSWQRWTILAMLAYAFLAVTERAKNPTPQGTSLITLTCSEIKRLFNTFIAEPLPDLPHRLHWSILRRRHQHRARASHYRRRQALAA